MPHDETPLQHGFDHAVRRSAHTAVRRQYQDPAVARKLHEAAMMRVKAGDMRAALLARRSAPAIELPTIKPINGHESTNPLRPRTLSEMIGQQRLKPLLARLIATAKTQGRPVPHLLMVGAAGTGKTTLATVIGNEIGRQVFALKAPVDTAMLMALQKTAQDRDVIFIDEVHLQCSGDRRGLTTACDPESFYALLEDGVLATPSGPLSFPNVTWVAATTDAGLLPQPLIDRFVVQPQLDPYTEDEMAILAQANAVALGLRIETIAAVMFGRASRGIPRQLNTYVKQARALGHIVITEAVAYEVIVELSSTTLDGLTRPMVNMLRFLLASPRIVKGETSYKASVNSIATAIGFGRDTKHVALMVEPELMRRGLVQVTSGGRMLTDAGIARARAL